MFQHSQLTVMEGCCPALRAQVQTGSLCTTSVCSNLRPRYYLSEDSQKHALQLFYKSNV